MVEARVRGNGDALMGFRREPFFEISKASLLAQPLTVGVWNEGAKLANSGK